MSGASDAPLAGFDALARFHSRAAALPFLGLGISTEIGARRTGLDPLALHARLEGYLRFLEIGADLERGVDEGARAWVAAGLPCTYHFLDVNLEEEDDLDEAWMRDTTALARELGAAWLCGDAGLWHVGPRDRGHGVLMPPVLEPDSAAEMARSVRRLRAASGMEVLPENPPAHVYVGRMSLPEYFAAVCSDADSGMLLDVAHLAIHQRAAGRAWDEGIDDLPYERVVEVHVAGGKVFSHAGRELVDDDHGLEVLPETWRLLERAVERAPNLRAVVVECERNPLHAVLPLFARVAEIWDPARAS